MVGADGDFYGTTASGGSGTNCSGGCELLRLLLCGGFLFGVGNERGEARVAMQ